MQLEDHEYEPTEGQDLLVQLEVKMKSVAVAGNQL